MRNGSDKICRENQNTHFVFSKFFSENCADYQIMWKYMAVLESSRITMRRMRITCWMHNATYTNSEHIILIAFPLQRWLHERASLLTYTHITCLVITLLPYTHYLS